MRSQRTEAGQYGIDAQLSSENPVSYKWYADAMKTWGQVLDESAERFADETLFVCNESRVTYSQFSRMVDDFAKGLLRLDVGKGDVVGIWMSNRIEWAVCQFAIYKIGALLLPLYSYYRKTELSYALNQANVSVLIMADSFIGKIDALSIACETIPELRSYSERAFRSDSFPALRTVIVLDEREKLSSRYNYEEVARSGNEEGSDVALLRRQATISPFDVMNIMYTSGTTGFPKGGMSMHVTNMVTTGQWSELAQLTKDDVILCHVPMFTNFGGLYAVPLGIKNGCTVIITEQFDAGESLRLIEKESVTYIPGTPSMFRMLLDHADLPKRNLSSVRGGHVAGAPLTETTMHEILEVLGARDIMQAWGLSECGGLSTVSTKAHTTTQRLKSVGKPLDSVKLRIVDSLLEDVAPGEQGEIILGDVYPGSCIGKGYFGMLEKTATVIIDDMWFRTGDTGYRDKDGFLYITGRIDDMFTLGGFNVYPAEIEGALEKIDGVSEAFVVPLADNRLGNVPVAWISLAANVELSAGSIVDYCRKFITSQKVPRRIFFYKPGELPMTPAGKVKKKDLAAQTAALVATDPSVGIVNP